MDIKNITNGTGARVAESGSQTVKTANQNTASSAKGIEDKVTISSSIQELEQQAKASRPDNSARIEELKQKIKDGSYQVDAEKVASKLIETELLLTGS